jgi:hypothetical protein
LQDLQAELDQIIARMWVLADPSWQIRLGPLFVHRRVGSQTFTRLFVSFNLLLGVAGGVLIFFGGSFSELGIALVVGAAFSLGAFLTEVWSLTVQGEREARELVRGDDLRNELRGLRRHADGLIKEIGRRRSTVSVVALIF